MKIWDRRGSSPLANFPKRSPISSCDGTAGDSGTQLNSSKKQIRSTVLCAMVLHIGAWYCDGDSGRQLNCRKKLIRNLNLLRSSLQFQRDSLMISQRPLCMEFVYCSSSITRRSVIVFESENQSDPKKLLCCLVPSQSTPL